MSKSVNKTCQMEKYFHAKDDWHCLCKNCAPPNSKRTRGDSVVRAQQDQWSKSQLLAGRWTGTCSYVTGAERNHPALILAASSLAAEAR